MTKADANLPTSLVPGDCLRVSFATGLAGLLMRSLLGEFQKERPDLRLQLDVSDAFVDVAAKEFDVVIRIAEEANDAALTAKRLLASQRVLAASLSYLVQHGCPWTLRSLKKHKVLGSSTQSAEGELTWRFAREGRVKETTMSPYFLANDDLALITLACHNTGILYMPKIYIDNEVQRGRLKIIELNDAEGPEVGVFALYPHPVSPPQVRAFVDFVGKQLEQPDSLERWQPFER